jgi:molybdopterin-containing oxidoreductase family molybdopterin binding subunit
VLQGEERTANCVCRVNCFGACRIKATVREDKVVNLGIAPFKDEHYNRICLRGLTHIQRIYDPKRIMYPMKRVGERGSGEFERISWDEATDLIAEKIREAQKDYGPQAVAFWAASGSLSTINGGGGTPSFMSRFTNVLGATNIQNSVDMAQSHGQGRVLGGNLSSGLADLVNSKTIICWGYNATESTIHSWHLIADAMDVGAKLVVIDPTYTTLASKADRWISVRCGTDTALALSCMQVIYSENLIDEEFLLKHTVAPFLVKEDGLFLRMSDIGIEPIVVPPATPTGQETFIDPPVVWDIESNRGVSEMESQQPALEGDYVVEGHKCRTAFSHLRDEFEKYPPEVAAKIVDIAADDIVELARLCADGPVAHLMGYGSQAYGNGVAIGMVMATLPALTGNYGYPGAQQGTHWKFFPGFNYLPTMPDGKMAAGTISNMALPMVFESGKFKGKDWPMKVLWQFVGNPLCNSGDTNLILTKIWPHFDFIITSDLTFHDTALWSDLVLPIPHYFEVDEVHCSGEHGFCIYSEKAIDPLYEAKSDADIVRLVSQKLGIGNYFSMSDDEYTQNLLDSAYCESLGISVEALKREGCMYDGTNPSIPTEGLKFRTASTRVEFYCEKPVVRSDYGQDFDVDFERLPRFKPPIEAWPENALYNTYPLVLMSERPRFRVHSSWWDVPWLRELEPEPVLKINPEDAVARDIANGDYIEAFNDRGHAVAKALLHPGIRKGTLVYPKGWQAQQHIAGSWSELVSYTPDPVGMNGNFMDVLCEIRPWTGKE